MKGARGALIALGIGVGAAALAGGAMLVVAAAFARELITPPRRPSRDARILAVDEHTVTLTNEGWAGLRGRYGLWTDDDRGYAKIGDVLGGDARSVVRELVVVEDEPFAVGLHVRVGSSFYRDPRELGFPTEDVVIDTPVGPAPAWLVPSDREHADAGRWAILVHGRDARRWETIRAIPVLRSAGRTSLVVSYRNDPGAPSAPDGRYALGDREWEDVEAAIGFAVSRGAQEVILVGWSMGGQIVLQTLLRSERGGAIAGAILDSPAIDWRAVIRLQIAQRGLPAPVAAISAHLLSRPWADAIVGHDRPIEIDRLDGVAQSERLRVPILILFSADDGVAPIEPARALAAARPDIVDLVEFTGARHVRIWNMHRERYEASIAEWLDRLDLRP